MTAKDDSAPLLEVRWGVACEKRVHDGCPGRQLLPMRGGRRTLAVCPCHCHLIAREGSEAVSVAVLPILEPRQAAAFVPAIHDGPAHGYRKRSW